jgi:hypothetical protein
VPRRVTGGSDSIHTGFNNDYDNNVDENNNNNNNNNNTSI